MCPTSIPSSQQRRFDVMMRRPENRECFDCGARQPRWASTNLGVFFCLRCAGIHRALGTHISKVKSVNMDAWETFMIDRVEHIGNARGRLLYEYGMPDTARPNSRTDPVTLERLLRAKYEKKLYYHPDFDRLLHIFLSSAVESSVQLDVTTARSPATAVEHTSAQLTSGTLPGPPAPPAPAAVPVEELWGAPVTAVSAPANVRPTARMAVADLFSDVPPTTYSSHAMLGRGSTQASPTAVKWGSPASTSGASTASGMYMASPADFAPVVPLGATLSPTTHSGQGTPSNLDDLFTGQASSPSQGRAGHTAGTSSNASPAMSSKDEILSLFASSPTVGGGGAPQGVVNHSLWPPAKASSSRHPWS